MNCTDCSAKTKKHGTDRKGHQRYRCVPCGKTFIEPKEELLGGMYLPEEKALLCLRLLVEGMSIRSIERTTEVHRDTILRLLEVVGKKCLWIQENLVKNVKVEFAQADEIWSFVGMKQKQVNERQIEDASLGSQYCFTSLDSDTKLILAWHLGKRNEENTRIFLRKIRKAIEGGTERFQLSTDSFTTYNHNVPVLLSKYADYGQVHKSYSTPNPNEVRYSAGRCVGCSTRKVMGNPIKEKISTSHVEAANLTMRMSIRRMTRLTNAFSKKWDNLNYSLALHFAYYNFCRSHKTLNGATPAMAANLTKSIWTLRDLLNSAVGK